MNYFKNCTTIQEVKSTFRVLAKENHPDLGGSEEIMKAIIAEYEFACAKILSGATMTAEERENSILDAQAYAEAIQAVAHLEGIIIELVGNWIWISGNTYPVKDQIKAAGFKFASAKKMWFFRTEEYAVKSRSRISIDQIKGKYGSQVISGKSQNKLA